MIRQPKTSWFKAVLIGDPNSEKFCKALFLLNLFIDIDIDEEICLPSEATKPMEDADSFLNNLLEKTNKCIALDEAQSFSLRNVLDETRQALDVPDMLDLKLQGVVAKEFTNYSDLKERRLAGLALLLIGKYARAICTARLDPSDYFNALTRFLLSHLSLVADSGDDRQKESFYLRIALLFEASQCAVADSSLGILKIIEGMVQDQKEPDWYINTIPYYRMLLFYNYALAYNHDGRRTKALHKTGEVCREYDWINGKVDNNYLAAIARYLRLPALQQHADLLNKMQFCFNSIQTLKAHRNAIKESQQVAPCCYKTIRALLLEASCWYDMGDKVAAKGVIHKLEEETFDYLGESLGTNLTKDDQIANNIADWKKCLKELDEKYTNLRMDAVKLLLQRDLEELCLRKNEKESNLKKGCAKMIRLKKTLENRKKEPFQRQNLKELAIDWLARLAKVKKVNGKDALYSRGWQGAITCAIECLDIGPGAERKGDISNEIWGKDFKRIHPTVRNRFFGILEKIVDKCEKDLANCASSSPNIGKKLFETLAEFELRSLGLDPKKSTPSFQDEAKRNKEEEVYPRENSYLYRKIKRRGAVLLRYIEATSHYHWLTDIKKIQDQFLWINTDPGSGADPSAIPVGKCLKKTIDAWEGGDKSTRTEKETPLRLGDYKHIINDSDFTARLTGGRTVQPVHFPKDKKDKKNAGLQFVALRRWNSYTPEISFSRGGGYFLFLPNNEGGDDRLSTGGVYRKTRLGVVVDPGFDFIHNFFSQGFSLDDINVVVITHADADHINDFRGLADLLREREKRDGENAAKIYTFMPRNTRKLLERYITDEAFRRLYYDTVLVDLDENLGGCSEFHLRFEGKKEEKHLILRDSAVTGSGIGLIVRPVEASHDDHAGDTPSAWGYVLEFKNGNKTTSVGFTGDSQWFPEYAGYFRTCHLICSHMGSPLGDEYKDYDDKKISVGSWEAMVRRKNHPYLPGTILFLEQLRKQQRAPKDRLVVLSEFGEEMKGMMRKDICDRLNLCLRPGEQEMRCWSAFVGREEDCKDDCSNSGRNIGGVLKNNGSLRVVPADVGLRVSILEGHNAKIYCVLCEKFHDPNDVKIVAHGPEEAYFFICGPCFRGKSRDVRVASYELLLEHGRPLRKA